MLWIVILAIAVATLGFLAEPLLRGRKPSETLNEEDYLAAQIADIERDREAGLISVEEANAAEKEARRRLLAAHRAASQREKPAGGKKSIMAALPLAALAPLAAFLIYGLLGNPAGEATQAGQQLAARNRAQMAAEMSPEDRTRMISGMVEGLAARLEENPDDVEGWTMLGRSYAVIGEFDKSAAAYERAISLSPENPDLHVGRIEALMSARAAQGLGLNDEVADAVNALAALNEDHPFALYFQGLAASQKGDAEAAREYWSRLVAMMPEEAPERARLIEMINAL